MEFTDVELTENPTGEDHVTDNAGCSHDDGYALLQLVHILTDIGFIDTGMAPDVHVVTKRNHHLLDLWTAF